MVLRQNVWVKYHMCFNMISEQFKHVINVHNMSQVMHTYTSKNNK